MTHRLQGTGFGIQGLRDLAKEQLTSDVAILQQHNLKLHQV